MPQVMPRLHASWQRRTLRQRIFLLFAVLAGGALAALTLGMLLGYAKQPNPWALDALITSGVLASCAILALVAGLWRLFDDNVAKPLERLAGELRARSHAHITTELEDMQARHLGDLAPAATALMRHLNEARNDLAEAVARETSRQTLEKAQLISLLADLPMGVLVCDANHQLVFYNGQAQALLGHTEEQPDNLTRERSPTVAADCVLGTLCLGRSVFEYLEENDVLAVFHALQHQLNSHAGQPFSGVRRDTGQRLHGRMRLLNPATAGHGGYVLTLSAEVQGCRTVTYDFELLTRHHHSEIIHTPLDALTYVVFDTETTGLLPDSGDEIVQLAAVRIVNGRRVEAEILNTLVDPGRPIPASSTQIHGISDSMVAGAPPITQVARRFHQFSQGAVLVAHNAAFDLAFLQRNASRIGLHFDQPVLDTVLLSALVFGDAERHNLDALAARLDISLPANARHTALGDATATADALLKMLPALQARGLQTFGELDAACHRRRHILRNRSN